MLSVMLADCLHALDALGPAGLPALMGALFLMGLAGGASHCAAMCGPFVLAQVAAGGSLEGGGWSGSRARCCCPTTSGAAWGTRRWAAWPAASPRRRRCSHGSPGCRRCCC
ncbi:hypothetical protein ACFQY5_18120 [Paeniroseomonas aquatica]|uniref:hypothetical protein n=1 Tax=Paeniroseomonas aquatica TaxID=373043 RepID=UPI003615B651